MLARDQILSDRGDSELRSMTLVCLESQRSSEENERVAALASARSDEWLAFARRNDCAPIVAAAIRDAHAGELPGDLSVWKTVYEQSARRIGTLMEQLDLVAARLDGAGIRMVALKNAGIARGVFPDRAACPMGDVDVLVSRSRFEEAHRLVQECGFVHDKRAEIEDGTLSEGQASGGTEYVKEIGGEKVWLELQWRAVSGRAIGKAQEPDTDDLLARSQPIEGSAARLLAPVDNMIQVSLHTAKHSFIRAPGLRLHTDVERLAAFQPPDWDAVGETAERLTVRTPVFFSLALARTLLAADVPESVLTRLAPAGWKQRAICRELKRRDVFEPEEDKFSRAAMIWFHSLLYDDMRGWLSSALGVDRGEVGFWALPRLLWRAIPRAKDLLFRYQK